MTTDLNEDLKQLFLILNFVSKTCHKLVPPSVTTIKYYLKKLVYHVADVNSMVNIILFKFEDKIFNQFDEMGIFLICFKDLVYYVKRKIIKLCNIAFSTHCVSTNHVIFFLTCWPV